MELSRPPSLAAASLEVLPPAPAAPFNPEGLIEIVLPGGLSLRVDAQVDGRHYADCWTRWRIDDHAGWRCWCNRDYPPIRSTGQCKRFEAAVPS